MGGHCVQSGLVSWAGICASRNLHSTADPSWHRRARRQRQAARALLAVGRARRILEQHHSGGGARRIETGGMAPAGSDVLLGARKPSWSCSLCQTPDNWACRIRCRRCWREAPARILQDAWKAHKAEQAKRETAGCAKGNHGKWQGSKDTEWPALGAAAAGGGDVETGKEPTKVERAVAAVEAAENAEVPEEHIKPLRDRLAAARAERDAAIPPGLKQSRLLARIRKLEARAKDLAAASENASEAVEEAQRALSKAQTAAVGAQTELESARAESRALAAAEAEKARAAGPEAAAFRDAAASGAGRTAALLSASMSGLDSGIQEKQEFQELLKPVLEMLGKMDEMVEAHKAAVAAAAAATPAASPSAEPKDSPADDDADMEIGNELLQPLAAAMGVDISVLGEDARDECAEDEPALAAVRLKRKDLRTTVVGMGLVRKKARKGPGR